MLNLADPSTSTKWGFAADSLPGLCQEIGARARAAGYTVIVYPSYRGFGLNYAIFSGFEDILEPMMVSPGR